MVTELRPSDAYTSVSRVDLNNKVITWTDVDPVHLHTYASPWIE